MTRQKPKRISNITDKSKFAKVIPGRPTLISMEQSGKLPARSLKDAAEEAVKARLLPRDVWENEVRAGLGAFREALTRYLIHANEGHKDLIAELPIYTRQMVEACNRLAREHPDAMAGIAGEWIEWPMLVSWHYPKRKDFEDLSVRIGLAKDALVSPSVKATWKPDTPVNRFLLQLLQGCISTENGFYWVTLPEGMPKLRSDNTTAYLDEVVMPVLDALREQEGWEGIPVVRELLKRVPYEPDHRSAVRNRFKKALRALACSSA